MDTSYPFARRKVIIPTPENHSSSNSLRRIQQARQSIAADRPKTAPSRYHTDSNFQTYSISDYEQDLQKKTLRPKTGRPNRSETPQNIFYTGFNEMIQPMEIKSLLPLSDNSHQFFCNSDINRLIPYKSKAKRSLTAPEFEKLNYNRMKLKEFPDFQMHQTTKILELQNNYIKTISNIWHLSLIHI